MGFFLSPALLRGSVILQRGQIMNFFLKALDLLI